MSNLFSLLNQLTFGIIIYNFEIIKYEGILKTT